MGYISSRSGKKDMGLVHTRSKSLGLDQTYSSELNLGPGPKVNQDLESFRVDRCDINFLDKVLQRILIRI